MDSILSTEEQKMADALRDGTTIAEIAAEQEKPVETVERAAERIRDKTERAFATLAESPFTTEVAASCSDAERERLIDALEGATR